MGAQGTGLRPDPHDHDRAPAGAVARLLGKHVDRRTVLRSAAFMGALAAVGSPAETVALAAGVEIRKGELHSSYVPGPPLRWRVAVPKDARALVLALHGRDSSASYWFNELDAPRIARETGLAIAAIDGRRTYWHPRAGSDAPAMLTGEFLPLLAKQGLPTERIGLTGVSMGGFGALWLAGELGPARVFGVATMSAALRRTYAGASQGAFDDPQDFARNSIFGRVDRLRGVPLWLACGTSDRFFPGNLDLAQRLPQARVAFAAGGHTTEFSRVYWGPAMSWLARLASA
ncbi:hypothetical protein BJY21_001633 [Kineosphaera limosa]|uniref:Acyl-CoA:diacylglycerol acyltransferase n=1 Tax=Kineosphaera limosa NBRC 100340 TaxID=1184609 RepID=K6XFF0_9MICO|nr:alpha/beta hydrolase-fold protein [Kineosphaera limosa]NYE00449.1 hypothetical protein [Kineosphaera limosa]GAB97574.1 hypothetical protein KILIM_074_00230 [Kineosphaera limosa NBRC 100340]